MKKLIFICALMLPLAACANRYDTNLAEGAGLGAAGGAILGGVATGTGGGALIGGVAGGALGALYVDRYGHYHRYHRYNRYHRRYHRYHHVG